MAFKIALAVAFVCMVVAAAPHAEAAMSCGVVVKNLSPCLGYVRGQGSLAPSCCAGVKALNGAAKNTPDRQTVCKCLKSAASTISGVKYNLVSDLPGKCGVNIPYKLSPSTDCSKVK